MLAVLFHLGTASGGVSGIIPVHYHGSWEHKQVPNCNGRSLHRYFGLPAIGSSDEDRINEVYGNK